MLNAFPYLGIGTVPRKKTGCRFFFVEKLIGTISESNRKVKTDNWFASVPLAEHLIHECHLTTVGTINKHKRELPDEMENNKIQRSSIRQYLVIIP